MADNPSFIGLLEDDDYFDEKSTDADSDDDTKSVPEDKKLHIKSDKLKEDVCCTSDSEEDTESVSEDEALHISSDMLKEDVCCTSDSDEDTESVSEDETLHISSDKVKKDVGCTAKEDIEVDGSVGGCEKNENIGRSKSPSNDVEKLIPSEEERNNFLRDYIKRKRKYFDNNPDMVSPIIKRLTQVQFNKETDGKAVSDSEYVYTFLEDDDTEEGRLELDALKRRYVGLPVSAASRGTTVSKVLKNAPFDKTLAVYHQPINGGKKKRKIILVSCKEDNMALNVPINLCDAAATEGSAISSPQNNSVPHSPSSQLGLQPSTKFDRNYLLNTSQSNRSVVRNKAGNIPNNLCDAEPAEGAAISSPRNGSKSHSINTQLELQPSASTIVRNKAVNVPINLCDAGTAEGSTISSPRNNSVPHSPNSQLRLQPSCSAEFNRQSLLKTSQSNKSVVRKKAGNGSNNLCDAGPAEGAVISSPRNGSKSHSINTQLELQPSASAIVQNNAVNLPINLCDAGTAEGAAISVSRNDLKPHSPNSQLGLQPSSTAKFNRKYPLKTNRRNRSFLRKKAVHLPIKVCDATTARAALTQKMIPVAAKGTGVILVVQPNKTRPDSEYVEKIAGVVAEELRTKPAEELWDLYVQSEKNSENASVDTNQNAAKDSNLTECRPVDVETGPSFEKDEHHIDIVENIKHEWDLPEGDGLNDVIVCEAIAECFGKSAASEEGTERSCTSSVVIKEEVDLQTDLDSVNIGACRAATTHEHAERNGATVEMPLNIPSMNTGDQTNCSRSDIVVYSRTEAGEAVNLVRDGSLLPETVAPRAAAPKNRAISTPKSVIKFRSRGIVNGANTYAIVEKEAVVSANGDNNVLSESRAIFSAKLRKLNQTNCRIVGRSGAAINELVGFLERENSRQERMFQIVKKFLENENEKVDRIVNCMDKISKSVVGDVT